MRYWQPKLRSVERGTWLQFDGSRRIAIIERVEKSHPPRQLLRAQTWAQDAAQRELIGYFPVDELRLAAECVWDEYQAATAATDQNPEPAMPEQKKAGSWHPLLATDERQPGVWFLVDAQGRDYGRVRIVRDAQAVLYVAERPGERVGRYSTLRAAVEAVHTAFIAAHTPGLRR
ncbi:hypothetical protein [Agromyces allii]|uniref:Uncharacterized protein n=1 Tax=Agromyces allii TaxID=393607 RepID=A0ABN2Q355_9MICO|nr:hypothetical protein [Agromyces allii]